MSIQVQWADSKQSIIQLTMEHGWTWDDLYESIRKADYLITSVPHTVNMVIDIHRAGGLPRDFMKVAGDVFASGDARANEGQKIVVGANRLIQIAYSGFQKVYGHKLKDRPFLFASTLDAAYAILDDV